VNLPGEFISSRKAPNWHALRQSDEQRVAWSSAGSGGERRAGVTQGIKKDLEIVGWIYAPELKGKQVNSRSVIPTRSSS